MVAWLGVLTQRTWGGGVVEVGCAWEEAVKEEDEEACVGRCHGWKRTKRKSRRRKRRGGGGVWREWRVEGVVLRFSEVNPFGIWFSQMPLHLFFFFESSSFLSAFLSSLPPSPLLSLLSSSFYLRFDISFSFLSLASLVSSVLPALLFLISFLFFLVLIFICLLLFLSFLSLLHHCQL